MAGAGHGGHAPYRLVGAILTAVLAQMRNVPLDRRRRQRALGKLTPVEYELAFTTQAAVAA
jgi:hypothetical protein